MEKIKNILKNNKCIKLICGAGNEDIHEVEKLAFVYASAGFNMIDVSAKPDILAAAKSGIKRANKESEVLLCVSVGVQDDIHLLKAAINKQKCTSCKKCMNVCEQDAIFFEDEQVQINQKKCIGCSRCIKECENNAIITESKYKEPYTMLLPLIASGIDCVEFHCSGKDENTIIDSLNKIKSIYPGLLSICIDRSKLGDETIISLISKMIENLETVIIQADGKPMSGGDDDYKSTLQAVAFGELIRNSKLPVYLILSGGTNSQTSKLAKECHINIDGVALGSYARKIVKEYIKQDDFFENEELKNKAIEIASKLCNELKIHF